VAAIPVLGDLDLGNRQIQNTLFQLVGADGTGTEGLVKWRTDLHRARLYDGTSWRSVAFLDELSGAITVSDTATIDLTLSTGNISGIVIDGSISNTKLATMPTMTLKGNNTGGTAAPVDLTATQAKTLLAIGTADVSGLSGFVTAFRLDQFAAPTAAVSLNSQKITNLANGTAGSDAINLAQLQAAVEGRSWKDSVDAATTGALPNSPTYSAGAGTLTAGANAALAAQDGITLAVGDRLLVKNQASTFQNGVYDVTTVGSGAAPWVLTRSADSSTAAELTDASVYIDNGSTLKGKVWGQTNTLADLTSAAQNWVVTGDVTIYTAGTGLSLTAGQFSITAGGVSGTELNASVAGNGLTGGGGSALAVNTDGTTLEISADAVRIAAGAAGNGLTGGGGAALAVGAGTGISVAADTVGIDTAVVVRKFAADVGNGSLTAIAVTHSLGTKDVEVEVRRNSDDVKVLVPWTATSTSVVTVNFDTAPASNAYRVVVQA